MKTCLSALLIALFASGCCSIHTSSEGGRTMCLVENYGWRLFDLVPLVAGDPDSLHESGCKLFSDTVTLENNQKLLDRAIKRAGATGVRFQNSYMTDEQSLFTFYRRTYYTSAELVFDRPAEPKVSPLEELLQENSK